MSDDKLFNYIITNLDKDLNWKVIINNHKLIYKIYIHIDELWNSGFFNINQELAWIIKSTVTNPNNIILNIDINDYNYDNIIIDMNKLYIK